MSHFVPTHKTDSAQALASLFIQHIFRPHGLPDDITSDRGATFTSAWWREVLRHLKIRPNFSTAFHPQSDGQTERVNQTIEQFIRTFGNYQQTDWAPLLPIAEFAYNNSYHSSIGMSPFYANLGYHPRNHLAIPTVSPVPDTTALVQRLQDAHIQAASNMATAQATHTRFANRLRQPFDPNAYKPGAMVMLNRKHIETVRPNRKFDDKMLGPFKITAQVGPASFRLSLPSSWGRHHPVFHVSLLEPYRQNSLPARAQLPPPPPIIVNGHQEFDIRDILDSRIRRKKVQYLVTWTGYGPEENSWISASLVT